MKRNLYIGFALSRVARSEVEWHFHRAFYLSLDQDLKQDLEALRLEFDVFDTLPAHDKKSRHRVFNPNLFSL
jgi:hypothetical protein